MSFAWIIPTNVTKIATVLLSLDKAHLQANYPLDAAGLLESLYHALHDYRYPQPRMQSRHSIDRIEAALIRLLAEVNTFVSLLTPQTQAQLAQRFCVQSKAGTEPHRAEPMNPNELHLATVHESR